MSWLGVIFVIHIDFYDEHGNILHIYIGIYNFYYLQLMNHAVQKVRNKKYIKLVIKKKYI